MKIHLDFESRATVKLPVVGLGPYADSPETEVLCCSWAIDDGPVETWHCNHPRLGIVMTPPPASLIAAVEAGALIAAHNAAFERIVWKEVWGRDYDWAQYMWRFLDDTSRWRCTAAIAASFALPRSLDGASRALRLSTEKDPEGRRLIMAAQRRDKEGNWTIKEADLRKLWAYCENDVVVERAIDLALGELQPQEQKLWEADRRMNERGLLADLEFSRVALELRDLEREDLTVELRFLMDSSTAKPTSRIKIRRWCKTMGLDLPDTKADTVREALRDAFMDEKVRRVLDIMLLGNKTSVAKYDKVIKTADVRGRLINTQVFHGANTGRWSGSGIQPHNLTRGMSPAGCQDVRDDACGRGYDDFTLLHGSPTEALSKAVRGVIIPPKGHSLFVVDYASIEARVLCWLAGQEDALELFRSGGDIYKDMAASIFNVPYDEVTGEQRGLGKLAVLGLGYGMGALTFKANCYDRAGVNLPLSFFKHTVAVYRKEKYTGVALLWDQLEEAAIEAVRTRNLVNQGPFLWKVVGRFLKCRLPSGRLLAYCEPQLVPRVTWMFKAFDDDNELAWIPLKGRPGIDPPLRKAHERAEELGLRLSSEEPHERASESLVYRNARGHGDWVRDDTYGGKLAENVTQAVARDVLAEAFLRADAHPVYNQVTLLVHDEIVCEVPDDLGDLVEFEELIAQVPEWATGLPVDVEGWVGKRYGK